MSWTKKQVAAHFQVSLTAVDNWIRSGCPADYAETGRLTGMHLGDVTDWLRDHSHPDLRKRGQEAVHVWFALVAMRVAFMRPDPYLELLMGAGLSEAAARDVYRGLLRLMGDPLAEHFRVPADELVALAERPREVAGTTTSR